MNNLKYFREQVGVTKKIIASLLNLSVHVYTGYENGLFIIPEEIKIMISLIYGIPRNYIMCDSKQVPEEISNHLREMLNLDNDKKKERLSLNLSQGEKRNLKVKDIYKIKSDIYSSIHRKKDPVS